MPMGDMKHRGIVPALVLALSATVAGAGPCSSDRYTVQGIVTDPAGQPVPRARVYVLLDQVSEKKFLQQGFRATPFQADDSGQFIGTIDCASYRDGENRGQPNPCAKSPKHVTVVVGRDGFSLRAQIHRLKDLTVVETGGTCAVALPEIRLVPGE